MCVTQSLWPQVVQAKGMIEPVNCNRIKCLIHSEVSWDSCGWQICSALTYQCQQLINHSFPTRLCQSIWHTSAVVELSGQHALTGLAFFPLMLTLFSGVQGSPFSAKLFSKLTCHLLILFSDVLKHVVICQHSLVFKVQCFLHNL